MKGLLNLVLHAHLPFVRHPEWPDFLEEDWLYEAMAETYIPLLRMFERLDHDGIPFKITMSLTPTLMTMLEDPLLQKRFLRYIDNLTALARKEIDRTESDPIFNKCARYYYDLFTEVRALFLERYQMRLVEGFKKFVRRGALEIITCPATHCFLPLYAVFPEAVRAQLTVGIQNYERIIGSPPRGIWLAECAYYPGHEKILADLGLGYFFVDSHGLLYANPHPPYSIFSPIRCPSGVAVFARDMESSREVWSSKEGYPGDVRYREFYRDIGFDLPVEYLRPHMHECGVRTNLGIKYHRVTGALPLGEKAPYDPEAADHVTAVHALDFIQKRSQQVRSLRSNLGERPPIITSLYDAELFGHWWFEGPAFLEKMFRYAVKPESAITPAIPPEVLERLPNIPVSMPAASSWGHKGYYEYWINEKTDWIYRHLYHVTQRMIALAKQFPRPLRWQKRILNQCARETLLAQCSDWPFIMRTGTTVQYATKRVKSHVHRFITLSEMVENPDFDRDFLTDCEQKDNIFPEVDFRVFDGRWKRAKSGHGGKSEPPA